MKNKLILFTILVAASGSMDAWHGGGGYHGGYHGGGRYRGGWGGAGAGLAIGATTGIIAGSAIAASSNRANQDPYAQVDRYEAEQDLKDLKAENKQRELDRKAEARRQRDEERQSRKRKRSESDENDDKNNYESKTSDYDNESMSSEERIQELQNQIAQLQSEADLAA